MSMCVFHSSTSEYLSKIGFSPKILDQEPMHCTNLRHGGEGGWTSQVHSHSLHISEGQCQISSNPQGNTSSAGNYTSDGVNFVRSANQPMRSATNDHDRYSAILFVFGTYRRRSDRRFIIYFRRCLALWPLLPLFLRFNSMEHSAAILLNRKDHLHRFKNLSKDNENTYLKIRRKEHSASIRDNPWRKAPHWYPCMMHLPSDFHKVYLILPYLWDPVQCLPLLAMRAWSLSYSWTEGQSLFALCFSLLLNSENSRR